MKFEKLNKIQEQTLFKLCKVWGFLKYYHPQVTSGNLDWDEELFKMIPKLIALSSNKEVDENIYNWISSLGDFIEVEEHEDLVKEEDIRLRPDTNWIKNVDFVDERLSKLLIKIEKCKKPSTNYYAQMTYVNGAQKFPNEKLYEEINYEDKKYMILSLFRYWNVLQYLYPYRYVIDVGLDSLLIEFLPRFIECNDELSYKLTLYELIGRIKDGHSWIYISEKDKVLIEFWGKNVAPIIVKEVENKIVVVRKLKELEKNTNIKIGDVILKVNGKDIEELIKEKEKYVPPTNKNYHSLWLFMFLLRTNDGDMRLLIERDGDIIEANIKCTSDNVFESIMLKKEEKKSHEFIADDIGYICPSKLVDGEMNGIIDKFKDTKGIIVDACYYPSSPGIWEFAEYIMPEGKECLRFSEVNTKKPGEFIMGEPEVVGQENPGYYKGKVIIIINEDSISQQEFLAMALRTAPKATVIGSYSVGADGNCSHIFLPGGIMTCFTGLGVYYPDGSETQAVGIKPDIEVKQTIVGIRKGRDELIEKAVDIINRDL